MKYRITKYNILPAHLDNEDAPTYAVECKKHLWSKWKSMYWCDDALGNRVPRLVAKSEALEQLYRLTNTTCPHCKHCYGRAGEAEWRFRRCKIRKTDDGKSEKVIYSNPYACHLFERREQL